jgi:hypothetical protein
MAYSFLRMVAILLTAMVSTTAPVDQASHKICLARPVEVGQLFSIRNSLTGTATVTYKEAGTKPNVTKSSAELEGTEKVLGIEANTRSPYKVEVTVTKLTRDGDEMVPAGNVIIVENLGDKRNTTIDGQPVDPEVAQVLRNLVPLQALNNPHSNDDVAGTDGPKKAGDSWKANPAYLAPLWRHGGYSINEDDVSGTTELTSVDINETGPILHLRFKDKASGFHRDWAEGYRTNSGHAEQETESQIPEDPTDHRATIRSHTIITLEMTGKKSDGSDADLHLVNDTTVTFNIARLKDQPADHSKP